MAEELSSLCELAARLKLDTNKRLGVDGTNGVRKTTIAGALAMELQLPLISLDNFLLKNQGGFVEFLQYDELTKELESLESFVVEGVCLRHVLERARVASVNYVYVKRYHLRMWADERELDIVDELLEEFMEKERELVARLSGAETELEASLSEDIIRYHARYRPQEHAHYVFRWDER